MSKKTIKDETLEAYKARLRRTAMAIPAGMIWKAMVSIRKRAKMVVDAKGKDIPRD